MPKAKLADYFSSDIQLLETEEALQSTQQRVAELEQLVAQLRSTQEAAAGTALPLTAIVRDPNQMRRYFDPEAQAALVASIQEVGIREPLWVRPLGNGTYQLIAGERRYRAALELRLPQVPVCIIDVDDASATKLALIENLQREDPNPFEQTEAILRLLSMELGLSSEAVVALFHRKAYIEKRSRSLSDKGLDSEPIEVETGFHLQWQVVESLFSTVVARVTPESFRVSYLPLLKLPVDVQAALREGKLEFTKARVIATVKDDDDRAELLQRVLEQGLSRSEIREQIKTLKQGKLDASPLRLRNRFKTLSSDLLKLPKSVWADPKQSKQIGKLLDQLENQLRIIQEREG